MAFGKRFTQEDIDNMRAKQKKTANKRVIGAIKSTVNGIDFASKLELYAFNLFKAVKIDFEFQKVIELQPRFIYNGRVIRPITIIVDFFLPAYNIICDTKGFANDVSPVKYKLLKYTFGRGMDNVTGPEIEIPKTKEEVDKLVNKLLNMK